MASDCPSGQLNAFQRAMLQWNDLHPYHAVHVVQINGSPEIERLKTTIDLCLRQRGATRLSLNRAAATFRYDDDVPPIDLRRVPAEEEAHASLGKEVERQLALRFEIDTPFLPFRFFVMPQDASFLFGTTYFHPIADAESVAILMREVTVGYLTGSNAGETRPVDRYPQRHDRWLLSSPQLLLRKLLALPSDITVMRRSHRTPLRDVEDLHNRCRTSVIPADTLQSLLHTVRTWGITFHDLLLAVLLKALSPIAPDRFGERRRRNLSLGSIVNVRRDYRIDGERTFGLFLGSFVVTHPVPPEIRLKELAGAIHHQTQRVKRKQLYLTTPIELSIAGRVIALYSTPRQKKFYHKHHPLWGGITNMNMNKVWPASVSPRPLDYFRAVSTGPVTPLVLSATTFGDHMNLGLTYRQAVFAEQEVNHLQGELARQIKQLEGAS